jgi:hypothetical protein
MVVPAQARKWEVLEVKFQRMVSILPGKDPAEGQSLLEGMFKQPVENFKRHPTDIYLPKIPQGRGFSLKHRQRK